MEPRLAGILDLLIEDYIQTSEPVGSQALVAQHKLHVSPATIRNWYADLEADGWLEQPHTSAGRIPSEKAFRWYAAERLGEPECRKKDRDALKNAAAGQADTVSEAKACAKICTGLVKTAAVVGSNQADSYYTGLTELFKQPEFSDWSHVVTMGAILDRLDERLMALRKRVFSEPTILLGGECPFGNACGSVLITLGGNIMFILLGPMRMDYRRARNTVTAVADIIG